MAVKATLLLCASALLVKVISGQCIGNPYGAGIYGAPIAGYGGCGLNPAASTGGGFPVTSVSPIAPTGLSIHSENVIEGTLGVGGQLPFLGTVALDGVFPTAGVGTISYGCGSGTVGIVSESPFSTGILAGPVTGPVAGLAGGYNFGGCGCGPVY